MKDVVGYTFERIAIIEDEIKRCDDKNRIESLITIKNNILKFMRLNFKIINSREIRTIGYDEPKKICVIEYNHSHSGKSIYYYGVEQHEFDKLMLSDNVCEDSEILFKDKVNR